MFWCEVTFTDTNTVFTLHKLSRSNRSTTFLWASERVLFSSVPLKNTTVKFAVRKCSEHSFSFIAISSA